nr:MAG TPA: hypothetical protein [Bacteriophage sp.]
MIITGMDHFQSVAKRNLLNGITSMVQQALLRYRRLI